MAARQPRGERGAAFVEFIIVVPFLMMFLYMIIAYGVMFSFRQTISQAAVEGARAAAVAPSNLTYAQRRDRAIVAINEAFQGQIGGTVACGDGKLTCTIPTVPVTCGDATQCISVTLQYPYRANPRVSVPQFFGASLPENLLYTASARIN
ncbi:MAG TPA: TadE/TadG family type IV pilus assembly protein [Aeromicrobium sp.]|nr:TadE/TadG family type IV pilus assembly protein [Aeromicrobium sp.]HKY59176.1 TadE/TadG family type IV pilus assembly protein [Aeromicrobium sp.]